MRYELVEIDNITHFKVGSGFFCGDTKEKSKHKTICPHCLKKVQQYLNRFERDEHRLNILDYSFKRIFRSSYDKEGSNKSKVDNKCFKYIPLELRYLLDNFHHLKSNEFKSFYKETMNKEFLPFSFLDAGCGHGNVMLIASTTVMDFAGKSKEFPPVQGIDFDPENVKKARVMLGLDSPFYKETYKVMKGDIRTFKHYGKYDIIYFYVPLIDREELYKFLDNLYTTAKVGAVIITHGARECSAKLWNEIKNNFVLYNNNMDLFAPFMIKVK